VTAVIAAAAALTTAGCGGAGAVTAPTGGQYPMTFQNCGHDVTVERKPRRIVALGPSEVATLHTAGAAGLLVGRNDEGVRSAAYPQDLRDAVAAVPQLGVGGEVTRENVVALQPDLAVGSVSETLTPESLAAVGIPLRSLRGNCGSNHAPGVGDGTADFDDVYDDVAALGALAGTGDQARAAVEDLRRRVAAAVPPAEVRGRTAAAVIGVRGGLRAYGRSSMVHTQLTALGLQDVFGDVGSRVFDASIEEIVARDPAVVVILSYDQTDQQARDAFLSIPGAANLTAVRTGQVLVQPYEYSSQGTLSVTGLENMARHLGSAR
jgi:iron complex transport system substrate-binding protein